MRTIWLVLALMLVPALAGCFGGGGGKDSPSPTGSPTGTNETTEDKILLTVTILQHTNETRMNESVNVSWEVSFATNGTNATNQTLQVEHTDIHYGNLSQDEPLNETSYSNTSEEFTGPPRVFNTTFNVTTNGTIYMRAHAVLNGTDYWSDQVEVNVLPPRPVHPVSIGGTPGGPVSAYDPATLTIEVGDAVAWKNEDPIGFPHTATSDAAAPEQFDTGQLGADETSAPVYFNIEGTYTYHCTVHPQTMRGTIVVQAAG